MLRRPRSQAPSLLSTVLENRIRMALEEKEKEEKMLMDQKSTRMQEEHAWDLIWDSGRGKSAIHPPWARDPEPRGGALKLSSLLRSRKKL